MKKVISIFSGTLIIFTLFTKTVRAMCPICTIAVGTGLGISRILGIDDTISGVWIGAIAVSSALWAVNIAEKKQWKVPFAKPLAVLVSTALLIPPLYWADFIGIHGNTIYGIDKVLFGTVLGGAVFLISVMADNLLRKTNEGRVYIYYQSVLIPVLLLSITSLALYLIV